MRFIAGLVLLGSLWPLPAAAQQRPLVTEDPETIGAGLILVEAGFDYLNGIFYPVSGLEGDLLRLPTVGTSLGVGSIAEIQVDWSPYQRLNVNERAIAPLSGLVDFTGDSTTDIEDLVIATKVRFLSEAPGRPALGVRLATKLPLAGNDSGLGLETTDVLASFLIGKTVQSIRIVGNVGLGIIGDPTAGNRQGEVLLYGASIARALRQGFEVVGEINGWWNLEDPQPPGSEDRSQLRLGSRYTHGSVRVDGGLIIGLADREPGFGFTAGATWVFKGFTVP
jgi:hypothetical protein